MNTVVAFGAMLDAAGVKFRSQELLDAMAKSAASETPEEPCGYTGTAVDVETGALRAWDEEANAPLARAVTSSRAAPLSLPPVTMGGRRYMDGGLRTNLNADLVAGHDRVVAVSCLPLTLPEGVGNPAFSSWAAAQETELETVREAGEAVEVIEPGEGFLALSGGGAELSDVGRAGEAYEAGVRQARLELDRIRVIWNG